MKTSNSVFIAQSIDGYIADKNGKIDWLNSIPNPDGDDMAYNSFMNRMDAILMGRKTYETVLGFDTEWPYEKAVFVLSTSLKEIPESLKTKVTIVNGSLQKVLDEIHQKGFYRLYIDGGSTIQSFLKQDLIDEMIITTFPIILGGGASLFSNLSDPLNFNLLSSETYLDQITQVHYQRNT